MGSVWEGCGKGVRRVREGCGKGMGRVWEGKHSIEQERAQERDEERAQASRQASNQGLRGRDDMGDMGDDVAGASQLARC